MNLFKLLRPKQWIKNFFVFGTLIFSYNFMDIKKILLSLVAFFLFCMISSSVYILNDIVDIEKDKIHSKKRYRPLASGKVSIKSALFLMVILIIISIVTSFLVNRYITIMLICYLFNNIFYSFKFKNVIILDVFSISLGFLIRVITGGVAIGVSPSPWILLCTFFISLFLGFEKRKAEILTLGDNSELHRQILSIYSVDLIEQLSSISMTCTIIFYSLYTVVQYPTKPMYITSIFVIYGIFRYKYLIYNKRAGENPTETVLTDKSIISTVLIWITVSIVILLI